MSLTDRFFDLPPALLSALGTILGFALTGRLNYAQQNSLGNWLELIGQLLDANAAQGQLLQQQQQSSGQNRRLEALEREVARLKAQLEGQGSTEPTDAGDPGSA